MWNLDPIKVNDKTHMEFDGARISPVFFSLVT